MANRVNPPPFLRIPPAFLSDREVKAFADKRFKYFVNRF